MTAVAPTPAWRSRFLHVPVDSGPLPTPTPCLSALEVVSHSARRIGTWTFVFARLRNGGATSVYEPYLNTSLVYRNGNVAIGRDYPHLRMLGPGETTTIQVASPAPWGWSRLDLCPDRRAEPWDGRRFFHQGLALEGMSSRIETRTGGLEVIVSGRIRNGTGQRLDRLTADVSIDAGGRIIGSQLTGTSTSEWIEPGAVAPFDARIWFADGGPSLDGYTYEVIPEGSAG